MSLNTKADYLLFFGKNLEIELSNFPCDIEGQRAELFIANVEDFCRTYLMANYNWNGEFANDFQRNQFKKGALFQIEYVLHNSDLFNDSGVDADKGVIVSEDVLRRIELSKRAFNEFWLGGMANLSTLGRF